MNERPRGIKRSSAGEPVGQTLEACCNSKTANAGRKRSPRPRENDVLAAELVTAKTQDRGCR
jgi:hypothetical protein